MMAKKLLESSKVQTEGTRNRRNLTRKGLVTVHLLGSDMSLFEVCTRVLAESSKL